MTLYQSVAVMILSLAIPVAVAVVTHVVRRTDRPHAVQVQREDAPPAPRHAVHESRNPRIL